MNNFLISSQPLGFFWFYFSPQISHWVCFPYDRRASSWRLSLPLEVNLSNSHVSGNTWVKGWARAASRELLWGVLEQSGEASFTAVTFPVMSHLPCGKNPSSEVICFWTWHHFPFVFDQSNIESAAGKEDAHQKVPQEIKFP